MKIFLLLKAINIVYTFLFFKKKLFFSILFLISIFNSINSQVKIGDNPFQINPNSILELESPVKGIRLPMVSLSGTSLASPLSAHVQGMVVFNTAQINDVSPGVYWNDGLSWISAKTPYEESNSIRMNGNSIERKAMYGDVQAELNSNLTTISNDAITTEKISDYSVTNTKIANFTLTNSKLSFGVGGIYKGSGTLSGPTSVEMSSNNLNFIGSGNLNKFSGSLSSNSVFTLGRIENEFDFGIAATSGSGLSGTNVGDAWVKTKDGNLFLGSFGLGKTLFSNAGNTNMVITELGKVGINKLNPSEQLDVSGNVKLSSNSTTGFYIINEQNSLPIINVNSQTSRVGINGVWVPDATLDVNGQILIRGGNPGMGKVLMSDSLGLASWQDSNIDMNELNEQIDIRSGIINVASLCIGNGTPQSPWISNDGSAGIFQALQRVSITRRKLYFPPGVYMTSGHISIDFLQHVPNITDPNVLNSIIQGVFFEGKGAEIWINGRQPLRGGQPGILFFSPNTHLFYWKWTGLTFYGDVDAALVQFGIDDEGFPLNSCDIDLILNNGYVPSNVNLVPSPSRAIKIFRLLESRVHLVAVSATGVGAEFSQMTFCTISGAFSNTHPPGSYAIYPFSYSIRMVNSQSNTFTHIDFEIAKNCIEFNGWSIQNTFSAIFVGNCDANGYVFDNRNQSTTGKNLICSIRNSSVYLPPGSPPAVQELFFPGSDQSKIIIQNYFAF